MENCLQLNAHSSTKLRIFVMTGNMCEKLKLLQTSWFSQHWILKVWVVLSNFQPPNTFQHIPHLLGFLKSYVFAVSLQWAPAFVPTPTSLSGHEAGLLSSSTWLSRPQAAHSRYLAPWLLRSKVRHPVLCPSDLLLAHCHSLDSPLTWPQCVLWSSS